MYHGSRLNSLHVTYFNFRDQWPRNCHMHLLISPESSSQRSSRPRSDHTHTHTRVETHRVELKLKKAQTTNKGCVTKGDPPEENDRPDWACRAWRHKRTPSQTGRGDLENKRRKKNKHMFTKRGKSERCSIYEDKLWRSMKTTVNLRHHRNG